MPHLAVPVNDNDHVQGVADAPLTLVEYGDFQCPSCRMAYPVVKHLQRQLGAQLRFVYRHFPLPQHPLAAPAAEASEFAAGQGKFWEMHDALYDNQPELGPELFAALATKLGLNERELDEALEKGTYAELVEADMEGGEKSGVAGTPTFYINGQHYRGAASLHPMLEALQSAAQEGL